MSATQQVISSTRSTGAANTIDLLYGRDHYTRYSHYPHGDVGKFLHVTQSQGEPLWPMNILRASLFR